MMSKIWTNGDTNESKTLWEKEKLLLISNYSFYHNTFKNICYVKMSIYGVRGLASTLFIDFTTPDLLSHSSKNTTLTSTIFVCQIWKSPHIAEPNRKTNARENKFSFVAPFPAILHIRRLRDRDIIDISGRAYVRIWFTKLK